MNKTKDFFGEKLVWIQRLAHFLYLKRGGGGVTFFPFIPFHLILFPL